MEVMFRTLRQGPAAFHHSTIPPISHNKGDFYDACDL